MPGLSFQLRRGNRSDAAALGKFAARSYAETFGHATRPEDLAAYLAATYGERQQREELTSPNVITILAEFTNVLVGYTQVRLHPPPECVAGDAPVELWRFYVDQPWQGRGLAQQLLTAAQMAAASELGGRTLWLSVWERNARAISFYAKNGFRDVGTHPF